MFSKLYSAFLRDERAIPIGIKLVVMVLFFRALGWGFADPLFAIYLNQFQSNYTLVGAFVSFMQLASFLMVFPLIRLMDRVKEGVLIRDGEVVYFFAIVSYILAGVFQNLPLLFVALLLNGIGQPLIVVGAESYIRKHDRGGRATPFGFYVAMDYLGWIIGMVLGAYGIRYYGLNWMFVFIIPSILLSFFILPRLRERGITSFFLGLKRYFHRKEDFLTVARDFKNLNPKMLFFLALAFFDGVIRMFSLVFIPLFGLYMNLSLTSISLLMAVMYFPFIFSFFFSELEDRLPRMNLIAVGLFMGALSYALLFLIIHQTWVLLLIILTSFSIAIIRPAYNSAITQLTPRPILGEVTGLNNLFEKLGRFLGPVLTGVVADVYGIKMAFLLVASLALFLGILSLCLRGYNVLVGATET